MGHCKECKHACGGGRNGLSCTHPKIIYGYGHKAPPDDGAIIEDDEGWGMIVGPLFGCIHFEPKP